MASSVYSAWAVLGSCFLLPAMHSMNKRNDISLKGRLLSNLRAAKTTGLISRDFPAARVLSFA
jgi:hypothetical protein